MSLVLDTTLCWIGPLRKVTTEKSDALASNTIQEITDFFIKPEISDKPNQKKQQKTKKKQKNKKQKKKKPTKRYAETAFKPDFSML